VSRTGCNFGKFAKGTSAFGKGKHWGIGNSGDEGTNILAMSGTRCAAETFSTGPEFDHQDVGTVGGSIGGKTKAKGGVGTGGW
jgi:hypothetical protein